MPSIRVQACQIVRYDQTVDLSSEEWDGIKDKSEHQRADALANRLDTTVVDSTDDIDSYDVEFELLDGSEDETEDGDVAVASTDDDNEETGE